MGSVSQGKWQLGPVYMMLVRDCAEHISDRKFVRKWVNADIGRQLIASKNANVEE